MNVLPYLLNVSACLAVFYLVYWLGLRKLTFFAANRLYLLLTSAVSWLLPALRLPADSLPVDHTPLSWVSAGLSAGRVLLPAEVVGPLTGPAAGAPAAATEPVLLALYLAGAAWMLLRLAVKLGKLAGLLRRAPSADHAGYPVVRHEGPGSNASFLGTIFLGADGLDAREQALVLAHERSHLAHRHSLDVLWVEAMKVVLWFNPAVYLYGQALRLVHEFQADAAAGAGDDRREYARLLLKLGGVPVPALVQSFGGPPLSRRIHTLFAAPSRGWRRLHYLCCLPALAAGLVLGSCNRKEHPVAGAGETPLLFVDGREQPFASLAGVDPAQVTDIRVYTGADAVAKAGTRATKGAVFLTSGHRAPGTGQAEFYLPNGEMMAFTRRPGHPGKLNFEVRYRQPGAQDVITSWSDEIGVQRKLEAEEDAFEDALALKPAFYLTLLAHYSCGDGSPKNQP
jgi:hypothetical protein